MRARESAGPAGDAVSPRAIERVLARLAGARDWRIAETGDAFGGTLTLRSETRSGRLVLDASLVDTVLKREAEYGFELDANDIKQIESVLRVKYCGKEGLIGPC